MSPANDLDRAIAKFATGLRILLSLSEIQCPLTSPSGDITMSRESVETLNSDRYDVLVVENYEDRQGAGKSSWTRVGVAFPHKDGNGMNESSRPFLSAENSSSAGTRARPKPPDPLAMNVLYESDSVFCASSSCILHVRPGDPNVRGRGNWAALGGGLIVGRQRIDGVMLCDGCAANYLADSCGRKTSIPAAAKCDVQTQGDLQVSIIT